VLTKSNVAQMTTRVAIQNERPALPKDMPREYSEIINRCALRARENVCVVTLHLTQTLWGVGAGRCWQRDPRLRPDFADILPVLREMHEALRCLVFLCALLAASSKLQADLRE
jgi:hypothetical protein